MYINTLILAALVPLNTVQAFNLTSTPPSQHTPANSQQTATSLLTWARSKLPRATNLISCPPVWSTISTALTAQFLADGQCTDAARAAIRAAFHDCFNGACDGSLILADECANAENSGLQQLCSALLNISIENQVGVADLIQFAAAHAIRTCPGGPTVPVAVGRRDVSEANSEGVLPHGDALGGDLVTLFASKGLTPTDLTALIGAHTTAKQRTTDPTRAEAAMDSTPGIWDNRFYAEASAGSAPFTLAADGNLARDPSTAGLWASFAASKAAWDESFVTAMVKLGLLGVEEVGLVDCTGALPVGSGAGEVRRRDIWERLGW